MRNKKYDFLFIFKLFLVKIFLAVLGVVILQACISIPMVFSILILVLLLEVVIIAFRFVDILKSISIAIISYISAFCSFYLLCFLPFWFNFIMVLLGFILILFFVLKTNFVYNVYNTLKHNGFVHALILIGLLVICIRLFALAVMDINNYFHSCYNVLEIPLASVSCVAGAAGMKTPLSSFMLGNGSVKGIRGVTGVNFISNPIHSRGFIFGAPKNGFATDVYELKDKLFKTNIKKNSIFNHYWVVDDKKKIGTTLTTEPKNAVLISNKTVDGKWKDQYMYNEPFSVNEKLLEEHFCISKKGKDFAAANKAKLDTNYNEIIKNKIEKFDEVEYKKCLECKNKNKNNVKL